MKTIPAARSRRIFRPITQEIVRANGKRARCIHLKDRSFLVLENQRPACTRFQFVLNGRVHDVKRNRLYERPGRAATEIIDAMVEAMESQPSEKPATPSDIRVVAKNHNSNDGAGRENNERADSGTGEPRSEDAGPIRGIFRTDPSDDGPGRDAPFPFRVSIHSDQLADECAAI